MYEGRWVWRGMTRGDMDVAIWSPGQPNNHTGDQYCVQSWAEDNYLFSDIACDAKRQFVCEKLPKS